MPARERSNFDERPNNYNFNLNLRSQIWKFVIADPGGGEGIRTPDPRVANAVLCQLSYTPDNQSETQVSDLKGWLRGRDLNPRPLGYEPNELPDCSTPRQDHFKFEMQDLKSKPGGPG